MKADKKGILAAQQAEAIIDEVRHNGGDIPLTVSLKRTKHGERRAQNCEKYDLGGGYRLITLLDGACLYIAFVGTHDEVDLWFKKQRGIGLNSSLGLVEIVPPKDRETENRQEEAAFSKINPEEDMYERELLNRVDDATLRHVFSGFYQGHI